MRIVGVGMADRCAQATAIARDAEAKIRATLGDAGFDTCKEHAGSWLNNLTPRPMPSEEE